jgi:signal-transduction protein with cAMP-binding, CBS, and nucleotidyltransferase domain
MSLISVPAVGSATGNAISARSSSIWLPIEYSSRAKLWRPLVAEARHVAVTDTAVRVVTDFTREPPMTVTEDRLIDDALRDMITAGVRALLVVRGDLVSGLITSSDIQGERPLQFLRTSSYMRHDEIEVRHIMTQWDRVPKLDWQSVRAARVYDVARAFKTICATHLVLVEQVENNGAFVRGLLSRTRLERQLGHSIEAGLCL